MIAKRIIPCLDVKDGRTVKGTRFLDLNDMGDPVNMSRYYAASGADELVLLDISASQEGRNTFTGLVRQVARSLDIPFTVGGGVREEKDVYALLEAGADKVAVNTAAWAKQGLIARLASAFGSQCVVLAIDSRLEADGHWYVYTHGGQKATGIRTEAWAAQAAAEGAGELLLTAINHDGVRSGYATAHTAAIAARVRVPVIASGGAGTMAHFAEVLGTGQADAALAAGVFHDGSVDIKTLKTYLWTQQIATRL